LILYFLAAARRALSNLIFQFSDSVEMLTTLVNRWRLSVCSGFVGFFVPGHRRNAGLCYSIYSFLLVVFIAEVIVMNDFMARHEDTLTKHKLDTTHDVARLLDEVVAAFPEDLEVTISPGSVSTNYWQRGEKKFTLPLPATLGERMTVASDFFESHFLYGSAVQTYIAPDLVFDSNRDTTNPRNAWIDDADGRILTFFATIGPVRFDLLGTVDFAPMDGEIAFFLFISVKSVCLQK
jgi:hypothetical protein